LETVTDRLPMRPFEHIILYCTPLALAWRIRRLRAHARGFTFPRRPI